MGKKKALISESLFWTLKAKDLQANNFPSKHLIQLNAFAPVKIFTEPCANTAYSQFNCPGLGCVLDSSPFPS